MEGEEARAAPDYLHRSINKHSQGRCLRHVLELKALIAQAPCWLFYTHFPLQFLHKQYFAGEKNLGLREIK